MHSDTPSYFHIRGQLTLTTSVLPPRWEKGSRFKSFRRWLTNQYISSVTGKVNATSMPLTTNQLIASLCWQQCSPLVLHFNELPCVCFFYPPRLVFLLNAPAPWRNTCPYIPSTAQSHWSLSQTIVKLQNRNEGKACSLSGHSRDRRRSTELWPGTYSLLFRLQSSGLFGYCSSMWKYYSCTHENTFSLSTFHLLH